MGAKVMEKSISEFRLGKSVTVDGVTIIPIEKVNYSANKAGHSFCLYGAKEPVAVIIASTSGVKAVDIEAREMSSHDIQKMAPGLTDIINRRLEGGASDHTPILL